MLRIVRSNSVRFSAVSRCFSSAAPIQSSKTHETKTTQLITDEIKNSSNPIPVFKRALLYNTATALKDRNGEFTYRDLYVGSKKLSSQISSFTGKDKRKLNIFVILIHDDVIDSARKWKLCQCCISLSQRRHAHPLPVGDLDVWSGTSRSLFTLVFAVCKHR
jgi:hypothetical protein